MREPLVREIGSSELRATPSETAGAYLKAAGIAVQPRLGTVVSDGKAGQRGDHRLRPADFTSNWQPRSGHQCLRTVPRADRAGTRSSPECHCHLAGLGFRSRLSPRLPDPERFVRRCADPSRHKPWGSPSRLLHHGHILKCGPQNLRTRLSAEP
jgi:hypothetical protein